MPFYHVTDLVLPTELTSGIELLVPCHMQGMVHRARLAKDGGSKLVYVDPCMHMQLGSVHKSKEGRVVTRTFTQEPPLLCS